MAPSSRPIRPSAASVRVASLLAASLCAGLGTIGCGKNGAPTPGGSPSGSTSSPAGPDLSTPDATLACATHAVEQGDFEALRACSTADGIEGVRRDLLAWNAMLNDKSAGPRIASRLPPVRDAADEALYRAAFAGDPPALFRLLSRTQASDGGPVAPSQAVQVAAGVERVEAERVRHDGTRRRVVLVWKDGVWKVERIAL